MDNCGVLVFLFIIVAVSSFVVVFSSARRSKAQPKHGLRAVRANWGKRNGSATKRPRNKPAPSLLLRTPGFEQTSPPPSSLTSGGRPDRSGPRLSDRRPLSRMGIPPPLINYGSINVSPALRDRSLTSTMIMDGGDSPGFRIVITDPQISKRHVWLGVKEDRGDH